LRVPRQILNPYTRENFDLFSEKEIIGLVCEEIGKILFMGKRTVDGIRAKILSKMNVKRVAGVAIYAIKNGIYHIKP